MRNCRNVAVKMFSPTLRSPCCPVVSSCHNDDLGAKNEDSGFVKSTKMCSPFLFTCLGWLKFGKICDF